jgi:hypothetical protein
MNERRALTRTTILKSARLLANARALDCSVRIITNAGAGIRTDGAGLLPPSFELSFDNFHTWRSCRLIWRHDDFIGVTFLN